MTMTLDHQQRLCQNQTKFLIYCVISNSNKGAKFMTCDLKYFHLTTPMSNFKYMKISLTSVPLDIVQTSNLHLLKTVSNHFFIEIKKGMHGLIQATVLAYNHLVRNLGHHGYHPSIPHTVRLWQHKTRNIKFCLCVDNFAIK